MSQKNSSFNFKKIPDLKKKKPAQDSDEAMPKSSAKSYAEIDQEDSESIIITNQELKQFENKKSSILKRGSNNNLVSRESEASLKPLNDLPDGILNFDSENENYTLEGDIEGLMSVSEPSTRVHTTHQSQHQTEPEDSEDEAVIDDFSDKKDHQERDNEKQIPDSEPEKTDEALNYVKEEAEPSNEDSHTSLVDNQNESDKYEDRDEDGEKSKDGLRQTEGDPNANARDISDEESGPENKDYSLEGGEIQRVETAECDVERDLVVENDLHVSDAEDESQEPKHEVQSMRENPEQSDGESAITIEKPILIEEAENVTKITSNNFDSTIDKIVADVTTKSVINKEKDHNTIDFSAFNWKPNVDFFNFGNSENEQMSVNIFNFGKGTPPPPQIVKKKGFLSGDRPRSKSLQRALAKRNGYN